MRIKDFEISKNRIIEIAIKIIVFIGDKMGQWSASLKEISNAEVRHENVTPRQSSGIENCWYN